MGRRLLLAVAAVLLVVLAVAGVGLLAGRDEASTSGTGPTAGPSTGTSPTTTTVPTYDLYLAAGDSLAAGYQPTSPADRTDRDGGYAGLVLDALTQQGSTPELVNLGCPGETAASLLSAGPCSYPEGSQLAAAEAVLAQQPDGGDGVLVTLQVGANDVQRCVRLDDETASVDEECVAAGLEAVGDGLPEALRRLRVAAPEADVVVLGYYNPFAVAELLGPPFAGLAVRSAQVQAQLNDVVASSADAAGVRVADVATPFAGTTGTSPGPVCSLTWMCADPPDVHATDEGYALMADAVLAVLPRT